MEQTSEDVAVVEKKKTLVEWFTPGNILTLIGMAIGGLWMLAQMSSAIAVQNEKIAQQNDSTKAAIARVERQASQDRAEILETLRDMRQELRDAVRNKR
jgi:hypothetical protein